jgi:hypothetical protein
MRYMLMFYEPDDVIAHRSDPEKAGPYWGAWSAYVEAVNQSGTVVSGAGLEPPATSTTIRLRDGARLVQDGPVSASKEQLGGFYVIDVPDIETALAWAARAPSSQWGATEVRPLMPPMPG